jgi:hypothetical protein
LRPPPKSDVNPALRVKVKAHGGLNAISAVIVSWGLIEDSDIVLNKVFKEVRCAKFMKSVLISGLGE